MKFVLFTDNIKDLTIAAACRAAKSAGFDGLDLTVRRGGHVLPEHVVAGLPAAFETADRENFEIPMISTNINGTDSPFAEQIIEAAHRRLTLFKMGYWFYEPFGTIQKQLDEVRRKLDGVVRLASRYSIKPCVHIHSGPLMSNPPLIYQILKDHPPAELGAYVDTMHMSVEGAKSGWEITLDLITPWVSVVAVKNYFSVPTTRDEFGQQRYAYKVGPVADGMSPLPQFFKRLKQIGYDGVVSFSSEYRGGDTWKRLKTPEILVQSAADLRHVKHIVSLI